ncbi:hypothetical protein [Paenibacillus sp. MMS20-IR301]|uniref:hypothetical protein n=1 Tax=Paenibacillus sp. MMS20-IR301 TaxID=2895946 RepID=UPI0028E36877|nr:hypothetical protein [Paenibacillus sp. MMS20-IR301]WNS41778.1 hypothetical protein LOS79_22550 [Paenibacillus sp. MMS20-IR301]
MPYTTGLITNTRATGTAASNIAVSVRNLGTLAATIIVEIFAVPITTLTLVPVYVSGYTVAGGAADIREFFIAGNVSYEVQISNTDGMSKVAFSSFGLDEFGNLVTEQRVLQSEFTPIDVFSWPI